MTKKFSIGNMRVRGKITMFSCVMLAFMIINAAVGLFAAKTINDERKDLYDHYAMGQYYLSESYTDFCLINVYLRNALFIYKDDAAGLKEAEAQISTYEAKMTESFSKFGNIVEDGVYGNDIKRKYEETYEYAKNWVQETEGEISMVKNGKAEEAVEEFLNVGKAGAGTVKGQIDELIVLLDQESASRNRYVNLALNVLTGIIIGVAVLAGIITFAYAIALIKAITIPVNSLVVAANKLADGDVNVDCKKLHDDDLGELMDDFAKMTANIKKQAEIANTVAGGDLTVSVVPRSENDLLGISLHKLVEDNNEILGNVKESTQQVTVGAEQVATASQSLAQGATEQASALEQVTASMNEIAERTKANASEANEAESLINTAKDLAATGNSQMSALTDALNDINESSETISKIIKTIDDIAFQTNILALNAAVEAARAGIHGKGFAVVAEEVRNLAAKSATAASETAEMIEDSIHKVANGMRLGDETAKALAQIIESIEKSVSLVTNIAVASNNQATAVAQVDQAIMQVSQVVQTNSATSEQCAAASEELSNQAANLRSLMSNFKLTASKGGGFIGTGSSFTAPARTNEDIISLDGEFGKY